MKHLLTLLFCLPLVAADLYVDNVTGNDANDGSAAKPFATIAKGLATIAAGDTLHLVANEQPYHESIEVRDQALAGTADEPTVIDGHGAVLDHRVHYGPESWQDEGDGVYSLELRNNAWFMDGSWQGFDLVFFDGKPGRNCATRDEMTPLSYFLFKRRAKLEDGTVHPLHNRLFVKLPAGKTPADVEVVGPGIRASCYVSVSHVTIRNLKSMYSTIDGFASGGRAQGIVFENIEGCYNMDQGISHHGSEVTVRHSWFHHNGGCGVVDVYPECRTRYENCLIEDDTFRGGVEFYKGEFSMENCIVRNVPVKALTVSKNARATFRNCLFLAGDHPEAGGISFGGANLTLEHCTVAGFKTGLHIMGPEDQVAATVTDCAFVDCAQVYSWRKSYPNVKIDNNLIGAAPAEVAGKTYAADAWAALREAAGIDTHSTIVPDLALPLPADGPGAHLDPATVGLRR